MVVGVKGAKDGKEKGWKGEREEFVCGVNDN